jgi:hypothetical protein
MKTTPLLALLILAATTAYAEDGSEPRRGRFEEARSRMFAQLRDIESASHKDRIRILQEAESCIQGAADREAYRACEDRERAQREQSTATARNRREALRARLEGMRQTMAHRY